MNGPNKNDDGKKIFEFVRRRALEIVQLPEMEREDRITDLHAIAYKAMRRRGADDSLSLEWADRIVEYTRTTVRRLEAQTRVDNG
jgi:2-C-methyl-D-erythritol 4-phosphate cytidylyltransferase